MDKTSLMDIVTIPYENVDGFPKKEILEDILVIPKEQYIIKSLTCEPMVHVERLYQHQLAMLLEKGIVVKSCWISPEQGDGKVYLEVTFANL